MLDVFASPRRNVPAIVLVGGVANVAKGTGLEHLPERDGQTIILRKLLNFQMNIPYLVLICNSCHYHMLACILLYRWCDMTGKEMGKKCMYDLTFS